MRMYYGDFRIYTYAQSNLTPYARSTPNIDNEHLEEAKYVGAEAY